MSFSIDTLHDFVLNILNDEAAKAAYVADPVGALKDAGLADLTPADVQEALPLVADSLPTDAVALPLAGGLPAVDGLAGALPVGELPVALPTDGLPSLDGLTGALPTGGLDGLTGALPGLDGLAGALPTGGVDGLTGALPGLDGLTGALPVALPTDGLPSLDGLTGALPVGDLTGALPVDGLTGALPVGDLTGALPTDGLPMDGGLPVVGQLPVVGDLPAGLPTGLPGLDALPVDVPSVELPSLPTLDTPLGDVTAVVDGVGGLASVGADTDLLDSASAGLLSNPGENDAPTLSTHTESLVGDLAAGAKLDPQEFGGSIAGSSELADVGGGLVGHAGGEVGLWGGADTVAGDVAAGVLGGPDGLAVAAESPLGNLSLNSDGDFSIQPANTSDLLDIDHLGTTGDAVAGTVAHYVSSGAGVLADGVSSGGDTLGGYLTGSTAGVGATVDGLTSTVSDGIQQGGDQVSEHLTNLPTTDHLPLDQLPELPQLPDLPDVDSGSLPNVGDVTSHLPVQLPDTSAVTDLVSHNPVTDAVHQSPVGGLVDGVTDHLPQVGDHLPLVGDLDLGL